MTKPVRTTRGRGRIYDSITDTIGDTPLVRLDKFAKDHPNLELVGAISGEGALLSTEEVKSLAGLPSKEQLIAETIAQLLSPVHDVTNGLSGNLHALLDGVEAKVNANA